MTPAELTSLMSVEEMEAGLCKHFWATDVTVEEMELGAAQAFKYVMELAARPGAKTDFLEHTDILETDLADELNAMVKLDRSTGFKREVEFREDVKCTLLSATVCSTDIDGNAGLMKAISDAQRIMTHGIDGFVFSMRVRIDTTERTKAVRNEDEEISFAGIVGRDELLQEGYRVEVDPFALRELLSRVGVPGSFKSEAFLAAVHFNHERFVDMLLQIVQSKSSEVTWTSGDSDGDAANEGARAELERAKSWEELWTKPNVPALLLQLESEELKQLVDQLGPFPPQFDCLCPDDGSDGIDNQWIRLRAVLLLGLDMERARWEEARVETSTSNWRDVSHVWTFACALDWKRATLSALGADSDAAAEERAGMAFDRGQTVMIVGLKNNVALNNRKGKVLDRVLDADGKELTNDAYSVRLSDGETKRFYAHNLQVVESVKEKLGGGAMRTKRRMA
jgi:hypothetical protein